MASNITSSGLSLDIDDLDYLYKPNFVLVGVPKSKVFGDIIPDSSRIQNMAVGSWESVSTFFFGSRVMVICTLALFFSFIQSVAYQVFSILAMVNAQITYLPDRLQWLSENLQNTFVSLTNTHTRELWWLHINLELRDLLDKALALVEKVVRIIKKFYLSGIVTGVLIFLTSAGVSTGSSSVLTTALNNHSKINVYAYESAVDTSQITALSLVQQSSTKRDVLLLERVVEHEVKDHETLDMIAEVYGLNVETIKFNNQITDLNNLPAKLFLPWTDGYIYKAENNISPQDLEEIYKIDANLIIKENEDILNTDKGYFPNGSFVFLPTNDFASIAKYNTAEEERKENLRRAEAERKRRATALANSNRNTYIDSTSSARSAGFIWPTTGSISRCVVGSHVACDIANPSAPAVFAAQNGTISDVYRYTVTGYGLAVVIDHGGGLKTLYAHLSEIYVTPGQSVKQGQSIGRMGSTGYSTGTHLHFEVRRNGIKQNPLRYLP